MRNGVGEGGSNREPSCLPNSGGRKRGEGGVGGGGGEARSGRKREGGKGRRKCGPLTLCCPKSTFISICPDVVSGTQKLARSDILKTPLPSFPGHPGVPNTPEGTSGKRRRGSSLLVPSSKEARFFRERRGAGRATALRCHCPHCEPPPLGTNCPHLGSRPRARAPAPGVRRGRREAILPGLVAGAHTDAGPARRRDWGTHARPHPGRPPRRRHPPARAAAPAPPAATPSARARGLPERGRPPERPPFSGPQLASRPAGSLVSVPLSARGVHGPRSQPPPPAPGRPPGGGEAGGAGVPAASPAALAYLRGEPG